MSKLVAHPESGEPVFEEINYIAAEREQIEADVVTKQRDLDTAADLLQAAQDAYDKAEVALEDSKSNLTSLDQIKPRQADAGSEDAGSKIPSPDNAGDSVDTASEQPGDSGDAESVPVKVTVEDSVDEY